jgi:hypothetical protein
MKPVTIKRTTDGLPLMILNAAIALFPGLYMLFQSKPGSITFIVGALLTFLVIVTGTFIFVAIFKRHGFLILTKDGLMFQDNDGKKFRKWEDIRSYQVETKTLEEYSDEMNRYLERKEHAIILVLKDEHSARISADKLSKGPDEIIELFDLYKNGFRQALNGQVN